VLLEYWPYRKAARNLSRMGPQVEHPNVSFEVDEIDSSNSNENEGTDICASLHVQSIFLKPLLPSRTTRTKILLKKCTAILAFDIRRASEVVIEATRPISSKFEICTMIYASLRTTLS
jgi:hypothetical protein